jgi:diacylglycerol kinase (ATP)
MVENNKEIWFIINMISGTKSLTIKNDLLNEISKISNTKIFKTEYAGHGHVIAHEAIKSNVSKVVAIGGDGTLNEVGSALRGSNVLMGVIPLGSGNGLARHLNIPLNPILALQKVLAGKEFEIDTCTINDIPFFCTAGVGFDAFVADNFAKKKTRGFITYIITAIQSFFKFKPAIYEFDNKNCQLNKTYFAITFANASQYGNDAVVAPDSSIDDGLIDMVLLKPFSIFHSASVGWRLFNYTFSKSKFVATIQDKYFEVIAAENLLIHFDGEPKQLNTNEIVVKINENKLKVIC